MAKAMLGNITHLIDVCVYMLQMNKHSLSSEHFNTLLDALDSVKHILSVISKQYEGYK